MDMGVCRCPLDDSPLDELLAPMAIIGIELSLSLFVGLLLLWCVLMVMEEEDDHGDNDDDLCDTIKSAQNPMESFRINRFMAKR